jgi:hypothetical protein
MGGTCAYSARIANSDARLTNALNSKRAPTGIKMQFAMQQFAIAATQSNVMSVASATYDGMLTDTFRQACCLLAICFGLTHLRRRVDKAIQLSRRRSKDIVNVVGKRI